MFGLQALTACRLKFPTSLRLSAKNDFFGNELNARFLKKHGNAAVGILYRLGSMSLHLLKVQVGGHWLQAERCRAFPDLCIGQTCGQKRLARHTADIGASAAERAEFTVIGIDHRIKTDRL